MVALPIDNVIISTARQVQELLMLHKIFVSDLA